MNKIFKQIAGEAKLSYAKIIKIVRSSEDELEAETYTGSPEQLQTYSEMIVNECARLAELHAKNDLSLTTAESLMSIGNYIKTKFK